jgi:hypothetical protein
LAATGAGTRAGKRAEFFTRAGTVVGTTDFNVDGTTVVVGVAVVVVVGVGTGTPFALSTATVVVVVVVDGAIVATDA